MTVFTMAGEVPEFDPNPNPSDLDPGRLDASNPRGIPDSASTSIDGRRDPLANRGKDANWYMEYRSLGRTGVQVSKLCLGCLNFGAATGPEDSQRMIDRALDAGINFFDTANSYGRGTSEETVGEALRRNGQRDRVVLATKVHSVMDDDDPNMRGSQRRHIVQQCDESLRRLQTDYIDLYQLHRPQPPFPSMKLCGRSTI